MSNFSQSTKFHEDGEFPTRPSFQPRHARQQTNRTVANKHTSTPHEFMLCPRCREKFTKKRKEEKYANCALGDCDRGGMTEYSKALRYINSCHTIINQMMRQSTDCGEFFEMPDLPNFVDLFSAMTNAQSTVTAGNETAKKSTHESRYNSQLFESRSGNSSCERRQRSVSPKVRTGRSSEDQSLKQTTKGKFIELLPDVKQNKYKKQDSFSPGTTESEESDLELSLNMHKTNRVPMSMSNKFRSKIKPSHEKVIYEEDSIEEDSANTGKKDQNGKVNQKNKEDASSRPKIPLAQNQQTTPRSRTLTNTLPPMIINAPVTNENVRKVKQRSVSTVTPRDRPKFANGKKGMATGEVAGNFSDTVITAGASVSQHKKFGGKTLCTPIDIRNNELSQQDLDKYAKELLGSESPSPRSPRSKSPASTGIRPAVTPTKSKTDQQDKSSKKFPKFGPIPTLKSQAADQKRRSANHEKSLSPPPRGSSASTTNIYQKQEQMISSSLQQQSIKYRKSYSSQHQQQPEQQQQQQSTTKKPIGSRKSSNNANCYSGSGSGSGSALAGMSQHQNKANYCFGTVNQQCPNENCYGKGRNEKGKTSTSKDDGDRGKNAKINEETDEDANSADQINLLLCDNTETLSMHSRVSAQNCGKSVNCGFPTQFSVTAKPNDFFTTNRKCNGGGGGGGRRSYGKHEVDFDIDEDSDDIKTDSDIEDDHFEKEEGENAAPLSRKSSKNAVPHIQISQVLSHFGLLPNAQASPEAEKMMKEAKTTRAQDEQNVPFRVPRKAVERENAKEEMGELKENNKVYQTASLTHLHRTISEESSDIKSDDETYNVEAAPPKPVAYNFCLGNARYQT